MVITCLALQPDGGIQPVDEATALHGWRSGQGAYWIHLEGGRPEAVATWLTRLEVDPQLLDLLQAHSSEVPIVRLAGSLFVAYPLPSPAGSGKQPHFGLLCLDRLLVAMRDAPDGAQEIDEAPLTGVKLREGTTAGVVCALALVQASRLRHHVVTLRREGEGLADRMDSDVRSVAPQQIRALMRRVRTLAGVVDEELAVLEALKVSNLPALPLHRLADTFQVAIEIACGTDRDIDRLDRRLGDLQQRYESFQQELTNRHLGVLTVISAIFMPLTLIVGIYGMNFDVMPELHYRHGYPVTLAVMALITGGLYWFIRSRWWPR